MNFDFNIFFFFRIQRIMDDMQKNFEKIAICRNIKKK